MGEHEYGIDPEVVRGIAAQIKAAKGDGTEIGRASCRERVYLCV